MKNTGSSLELGLQNCAARGDFKRRRACCALVFEGDVTNRPQPCLIKRLLLRSYRNLWRIKE